jgi:ubiquinone/menaquinone biosynthesis C-methylase UbiE
MTGTSEEKPTPDRIFQLGWGFRPTKVLLSAIELDVFTFLAEHGPQTVDQLVAGLKIHPRLAPDFFDSLYAMQMLQRVDGKYSNTPETAMYLDRRRPECIAGALDMANLRLYDTFGKLTQGVRTGKPVVETGKDFFSTLYGDDEGLRRFIHAMASGSVDTGRAIAKRFPWERYKTFFDIGTSSGVIPVELVKAHPHLSGGGFDLPKLKPHFEERVIKNELSEKVRFVTGSFLTDPLPSADVLIMGYILHDWSLEQKKELIRKAFRSVNPGGALIVYEPFIDDARSKVPGLMMSLTMHLETPEGFECTPGEVISWMTEAGFKNARQELLLGTRTWVLGDKP